METGSEAGSGGGGGPVAEEHTSSLAINVFVTGQPGHILHFHS